MKICPLLFSLLHCEDHLKSLYNFFGGIFVTVFFVEIFNFIIYEYRDLREVFG